MGMGRLEGVLGGLVGREAELAWLRLQSVAAMPRPSSSDRASGGTGALRRAVSSTVELTQISPSTVRGTR